MLSYFHDMGNEQEIKLRIECLNCGAQVHGKYCSQCGQKVQPTKLPVKDLAGELFETVFNTDNRLFTTLKELFIRPGSITRKYNKGKRQRYISPVRLYLSISVIYFLLVKLIPTDQIFLISFSEDEQLSPYLDKIVQYMLFFMVPVMAGWAQLLHRRRKRFYVEYLVLALHIHTILFVLLGLQLVGVWLAGVAQAYDVPGSNVFSIALDAIIQLGIFLYPILFLKNAFKQTWAKAIMRGIALMTLYVISLVGVVFLVFLISESLK